MQLQRLSLALRRPLLLRHVIAAAEPQPPILRSKMTFAASSPLELDVKRRNILGLRAGCGALFACSMVPFISALSYIPGFPLLYGLAEALFYLYSNRQWHRLDSTPRSGKLAAPALAWGTFRRVQLGMMQLGVQPAQWLSAWFKGADVTSLGRNDVAELVATSIWHASKQEVEDAGHGSHLQSMVEELEQACAHPLAARPPITPPATSKSPFFGSDSANGTVVGKLTSANTPSATPPMLTSLKQGAARVPVGPPPSQPPGAPFTMPDLGRLSSSQDATSRSRTSLSSMSVSSADEPASPPGFPADMVAYPRLVLPAAAKGFAFQPGSAEPAVSFYNHTREALPHWHRPLTIYCAYEFMGWMNHTMLCWAGFKSHKQDGLAYYTYNVPATAADATSDVAPIVLLHGVGLGLLPYIRMVISLAATGAPVIAVEYKHVGQRWCSHVPSLTDIRNTVLTILRKHGYDPGVTSAQLPTRDSSLEGPHWVPRRQANGLGQPRASIEYLRGTAGVEPQTSGGVGCSGGELSSGARCAAPGQGVHIISHSFGTLVASSIVKGCRCLHPVQSSKDTATPPVGPALAACVFARVPPDACFGPVTVPPSQAAPHAVATVTFLDPVCFHMWLPSLLVNFVYRPQRLVQSAFTPSDTSSAKKHAVLETTPSDAELHITCPPSPSSSSSDEDCSKVSKQGTGGGGGGEVKLGQPWWAGVQQRVSSAVWGLRRRLPRLPPAAAMAKEVMLIGPAREMHCTVALCRLLDWQQASMWPEGLPPAGRCMISLSGRDELVPAEQLATWAHGHTSATVEFAPHLAHADILAAGLEQDALLVKVLHMINSSEELAGPEQPRQQAGP
ncbi:hypothetical protein QJQ45_006930 [Haematococcus lacustris]|nr:hypothetical protein QJQ45_006930 [Haematococcus lacustris]